MRDQMFSLRGALCLWLGLSMVSACSEEPKQVKPTPRPYKGQTQQATPADTPTVENTEERAADIRRVCDRKARTGTDISRCWSEESERRGSKKFDVEVRVMLLVAPSGKAQEANVLNSTPEGKQLEACIVEAVKGWDFPTGETVAPAQCNFILRPLM
jgi:hypothetical protein